MCGRRHCLASLSATAGVWGMLSVQPCCLPQEQQVSCPLDQMVLDTIKFSGALDDTSLQNFPSHKHSVVHFEAPDRLVASTWSATETRNCPQIERKLRLSDASASAVCRFGHKDQRCGQRCLVLTRVTTKLISFPSWRGGTRQRGVGGAIASNLLSTGRSSASGVFLSSSSCAFCS